MSDHRRQIGPRERIRQHLGLGLEDFAIPVLVAGHIEGEFSVTAATELKELADGDFLKLDGRGHLWAWIRCWGGRAKFAQSAISASSWTFAKHRLVPEKQHPLPRICPVLL